MGLVCGVLTGREKAPTLTHLHLPLRHSILMGDPPGVREGLVVATHSSHRQHLSCSACFLL